MSTKDYLEKDFYKVLGVAKDATAADIKKAYRKLARTHHPDANKGDSASEDRFKEISEAYDVLSDDKTRREYDEARALFGSGGLRFGPGGGRGPGGYPGQGGAGVGFDLGDLFGGGAGAGGGGLGDVLGGLFGRGRGPSAQASRRGADIESEVTLSFSEAVDGVTVPLRLTGEAACAACHGTGAKAGTTPRVCPTCQGAGQTSRNAGGFAFAEPCRDCRGRGLVVDDPCPVCHGSGRAQSTRTVNARIPAGVKDGQRIRLKGKGAPGERGGPAGDLYIVVHVAAHRLFGRRDDHLTLTLPATYPEAGAGRAGVCAHAGRGAGDVEAPGRDRRRTHVPGQGQGRRPPGRQPGRPAGDRPGRRPAEAGRQGPGGARGVPGRDRGRRPAGRPAGGRPRARPRDGCGMSETGFTPGEDLPVYVISVAAELSGLHAQTLRTYDRLGLVVPGRAPGGGRRYSARDIALLREVQRLSNEGVNLEGIRRVLDLEDEVARLRRRLVQLETDRSSAALVVWRPRTPRA